MWHFSRSFGNLLIVSRTQQAFVQILSNDPENKVFALVRSKKTIREADKLDKPNVHILEADVTDWKALKVSQSPLQ